MEVIDIGDHGYEGKLEPNDNFRKYTKVFRDQQSDDQRISKEAEDEIFKLQPTLVNVESGESETFFHFFMTENGTFTWRV